MIVDAVAVRSHCCPVVVSDEGSLVAMWAAALVAIGSGTIGLDRWYERRLPGGRLR